MTDKAVIVFSSILNYICLYFIGKHVFSYKPRKWFVPIPFVVLSTLLVICYVGDAILTPIGTIMFILQLLFIKLSFYKLKLLKMICCYFVLYCLNVISATTIIAISPEKYLYIDVIASSVTSVCCVLLCTTKARINLQQMLFWTPKYVLLICSCLLVVAAFVSTIASSFQYAQSPEYWNAFIRTLIPTLMLINCAIVPVIFMIAISNTRLKSLTADYEQQIRAQADHYKELARANFETRRFRHDFHNMRIALEELYAQGQYEKAMELLRRHGGELDANRGRFETGNGIADALLTDKQSKATALNSTLIFEGVIPPDSPEPTDLCVILGNTLDNAIEACGKLSENQDKSIHINSICCNGFWFLTVSNPVAGKVAVDNGEIGTTKENKTLHGFGLYSLKTVVRKYDGTVELSADENKFTARIELLLNR